MEIITFHLSNKNIQFKQYRWTDAFIYEGVLTFLCITRYCATKFVNKALHILMLYQVTVY